MSFFRPRKPTGSTDFMVFCIAVWESLWGGKFPFIDSDTVRWNRGPNGYSAIAAATRGAGSAALQITGEWDPGRTYSTGQVAIISLGSNAGTYVYISAGASSGHAPYAGGGYWSQLPMGQLGVYM